jgi:ribosomal protein S18 acetylase RimI-like enzyme
MIFDFRQSLTKAVSIDPGGSPVDGCLHANKLNKGVVRRFYETLNPSAPRIEGLPDDHESFKGPGIALMSGAEVRGLYLYSAFPGLQADTTLYYPYGGMLSEDRYTRRHQSLIQNLIQELKADSKVQIIVSLDQQPIQESDELIEHMAFWRTQGFSQLDVQITYQGALKYAHAQDKFNFSVTEYTGGDEATNTDLCVLYRAAYKRRAGIPNVMSESINKQLSIPSCSYLIMRHNDQVIGQVTLFLSKKECYVESIYVKRSYWGMGAADKLTQSLFNYARTKGCETVSGTAASNNRASCALMERFGLVAQHRIQRMVLNLCSTA